MIARGLVGWWRLDGRLVDESGNGNDATVGAGSAAYAAGKFGQAWDNDATRYATVSPGIPMTENMTFSFWMRRTGSGFACISRRDGSVIGYTIFLIASGINFDFRNNTGGRWITGYTPPLNEWVHIAITRTNTRVTLYVNGLQNATSTEEADVGQVGAPTGPTNIGATGNDGTLRLLGQIDNAMIYNRALAAHEIRQLYALGSPIGIV